jgi:hypothetical protein
MKPTLHNTEKQYKIESEFAIGSLTLLLIFEHVKRLKHKHECDDL